MTIWVPSQAAEEAAARNLPDKAGNEQLQEIKRVRL
jgi:hypothetical protein